MKYLQSLLTFSKLEISEQNLLTF